MGCHYQVPPANDLLSKTRTVSNLSSFAKASAAAAPAGPAPMTATLLTFMFVTGLYVSKTMSVPAVMQS